MAIFEPSYREKLEKRIRISIFYAQTLAKYLSFMPANFTTNRLCWLIPWIGIEIGAGVGILINIISVNP